MYIQFLYVLNINHNKTYMSLQLMDGLQRGISIGYYFREMEMLMSVFQWY